ncbi:DNA mismatch repair protein MutT [Mesorhizobium sp. LSJC268A00]|uniref:NUDIX hydrolase n=1 Tax=unclassified Mesorhizobium TaxID=325217 RepID=UPI0003CDD8F1|nr:MULTISPECIES: NUDIX domain-containing protein [unclassified Mesorhizobium]ESW99064.1 DNA mismatch repair protein MutT [Mesorhizobium sp. LSJC268A00]ESZ12655.1 DNA mismatch repair protein MutT [Mesorhizobium sp. L2C085B000]
MAEITKIGIAVLDAGRILLVKKHGAQAYILPGGKPEGSENYLQTLIREVDEELGCRVDVTSVSFLGDFVDEAAGMPGVTVKVKLYRGNLVGNPKPKSEIEQMRWFSREDRQTLDVAPSLKNLIFPFLFGNLSNCPADRRSATI